MLAEPMAGFSDGETKRAAFVEKQKKFKKAWRKELANLEFATNDEEFESACEGLYKVPPSHTNRSLVPMPTEACTDCPYCTGS